MVPAFTTELYCIDSCGTDSARMLSQRTRHIPLAEQMLLVLHPTDLKAADIAVQPTIEGIRAGRDEVLERAEAYLEKGR